MIYRYLRANGCLLLILLWLSFVFVSCMQEYSYNEDAGQIPGKETSVRVSLKMPSASAPPTYAISETDENYVATIDVLAFREDGNTASGWAYSYKALGTAITNTGGANGSIKRFDVTLVKSTEKQLFVVLANVKDEVEALGDIAIGADRNALLERLKVSNYGFWNANTGKDENDPEKTFRPFPMWGEKEFTLTDETTEIDGISMMRSIARLDIVLGQQAITDDNFKIRSIYVYNNNKTKGYVVPASDNVTFGQALEATIPQDADEYSSWNNSKLKYLVPATMEKAFERSIYLFESKAVAQDKASQATCIVIGGQYGNDPDVSYYRVDFLKADKKTCMDILRNHKYRVTIDKVSGKGYSDPEDAFKSEYVNMVCDIIEWNDNTTDTDFNGQYYLSVDKNPANIFGEASTENKLVVKTDYPGPWTASVPNAADNWIEITSQAGDELIFKVTDNMGGLERRGIICIKAGNLTKNITVIQSNDSELSLEILQNNNPVKSLFFKSKKPDSETIQVRWKPQDAECTVSLSRIKGNGIALSGGLPVVTNNADYTLLANEISDYTIANVNPFMENESILTFTVTDKAGRKTAQSVVLSQINYTLVATEVKNFYPMDGKTKRFKIKFNLRWKVQETTWPKIVDLFHTLAGEANTTEHYFQFDIRDEIYTPSTTPPLNYATASLAFSSTDPDPKKKFNNETIVNFGAFSGLLFRYNNQNYIAGFGDANNGSNSNWDSANNACNEMYEGWFLPNENFFLYSNSFTSLLPGTSYWTSTKNYIINSRYRYYQKGGMGTGTYDSGIFSNNSHKCRCVYGPLQ